jgi:hypothetical protein
MDGEGAGFYEETKVKQKKKVAQREEDHPQRAYKYGNLPLALASRLPPCPRLISPTFLSPHISHFSPPTSLLSPLVLR